MKVYKLEEHPDKVKEIEATKFDAKANKVWVVVRGKEKYFQIKGTRGSKLVYYFLKRSEAKKYLYERIKYWVDFHTKGLKDQKKRLATAKKL